jgi:hypothetical protein
VALAGGGTLTAAASQSASAQLAGAGAWTATNTAAGLAGTGILTASPVPPAGGTLTGAGTLTAAASSSTGAGLAGAGLLAAAIAAEVTAGLAGAGVPVPAGYVHSGVQAATGLPSAVSAATGVATVTVGEGQDWDAYDDAMLPAIQGRLAVARRNEDTATRERERLEQLLAARQAGRSG